ncbi:MAG: hypothetical protein CL934_11525 [Deltaproteobacteria bacterium]|nr:hypothetical protein [Deltaproteobacteria bacterium]
MNHLINTFIFSSIILLGSANFVSAAESGESSSSLDFLWKVINFVVLIAILYWFAKKPVASAMKSSAENAKNQLDEARRAETKAIEEMKKMRETISELENETVATLEKAREEAQTEKDRILEEGKREIERMRKQAQFSIEQEYRKAEFQLRQWFASESIKLAEENVKQKMTSTRQNKLVKEYLDQLSKVDMQGEKELS